MDVVGDERRRGHFVRAPGKVFLIEGYVGTGDRAECEGVDGGGEAYKSATCCRQDLFGGGEVKMFQIPNKQDKSYSIYARTKLCRFLVRACGIILIGLEPFPPMESMEQSRPKPEMTSGEKQSR